MRSSGDGAAGRVDSGWCVLVHAVAPAGTTARAANDLLAFTLEQYGGTTLAELATGEPDDPRHWWRDR